MSEDKEISNPFWRFTNNHPIIAFFIIVVVLTAISDAIDSIFSTHQYSSTATITKCSKYDTRDICQQPQNLKDDDDE